MNHACGPVHRDQPIMLIFLPIMLCCSAQIFTQYYPHVKELCLKFDCSIRVFNMLSVLLEYIKFIISM